MLDQQDPRDKNKNTSLQSLCLVNRCVTPSLSCHELLINTSAQLLLTALSGSRAYVYSYLATPRCPSTVTQTVSSSPSLITLTPKGGKNVGCYSESVAQPLMGLRTKSGMHPPLYHINENVVKLAWSCTPPPT